MHLDPANSWRRAGDSNPIGLVRPESGGQGVNGSFGEEVRDPVGEAFGAVAGSVDQDPAVASSVFVTMITDSMGFFAFLGLAVASGLVG